ncbi:MAG TPA: site-specific integrase [Terriglobales bacterium]
MSENPGGSIRAPNGAEVQAPPHPRAMRGDGRVYQRGERWWIEYWHRGRQYRESAGATEKVAQKKLRARLAERLSSRFIGPNAERVTVGELLDALASDLEKRKTKSPSTGYHIDKVRKLFGLDRAIDITEERLDRFIKEERQLGLADSTINRELCVLRQAYRLAWKRKRLRDIPVFELLPEDNARQGFFEHHELEAVVAHLPEVAYAEATRFAYFSGWRRGEILPLRWDAVDRTAGEVRLKTSKNGHGRVLPLEGELRALIERRWAARQVTPRKGETFLSPLVFHRNGRPIGDFRKVWDKAFEKAQVPRRLFHDLRRTAVRNMIRAGVPQSVAMSITGHRTVSMFLRYNITSDEDQREALRKVEAYRQTQQAEGNVVPLKRSAQ